jgi:hypothetical protein
LITISGTKWCVTFPAAIAVAFRVLAPASMYQGERAATQPRFNYSISHWRRQ